MLTTETENRIIQFNPWITHPEDAEPIISRFIPANYVRRACEKVAVRKDRAWLIVGPRQSGKSTMVWHQIRRFSPDVLFINMEDPLLRAQLISPVDLAEYIRDRLPFIKAVFIDEIQHMEEAGLFVKGLVDAGLRLPMWVTGSSSFELQSKTRESLAGRATRIRLLPFGLNEILDHVGPSNLLAKEKRCDEIVSHQLVYGSYPPIYLEKTDSEKRFLLNDLVEALILRDASDLFRIKRIDAFRKLLTLLAGQICNLINFSELASICNVDVGTIKNYIEILDESHIVKQLPPYAGGKRREITGSKKIFFVDNGIRNQLLNSFSMDLDLRIDKGVLFENWVFTEINKFLPIHSGFNFWRSKARAEVDFVIEYGNQLIGVETKFSTLKTTKITRSIRSFIEAYQPDEFVVLNRTLEDTVVINKTSFLFLTPTGFSDWIRGRFTGS